MPPPHLTIGSGGSFAPPPMPSGMAEAIAIPVEAPPFGGPPMVEPIPAVPLLEPYMPSVEPIAPPAIPVVEAVEAVEVFEAVEAVPVEAVPYVEEVVPVVPLASVDVPVMPTLPPAIEPIPPPPVVEPVAPPPPIVPVAVAPIVPPPPAPVTPVAPPPPTPVAATPVPSGDGAFPAGAEPTLVVMRGLKRNAKYPIYEGPNYIGRSDDKPVDIDLEDQEPPDRVWCSRQHAVLHYENQRLSIEDLNSSNGTFVNRVKIYPGQIHHLKPDDVVQIGSVQMKVTI